MDFVSSPVPRNNTESYGNLPKVSVRFMFSNCRAILARSFADKFSLFNISDKISLARVFAAFLAVYIVAAIAVDLIDSVSRSL